MYANIISACASLCWSLEVIKVWDYDQEVISYQASVTQHYLEAIRNYQCIAGWLQYVSEKLITNLNAYDTMKCHAELGVYHSGKPLA